MGLEHRRKFRGQETPLSVYIVALSQQKLAPEIRGVPIQHYPLEDTNIDPDRLRTENVGPHF